jgi:recombination protein RecA
MALRERKTNPADPTIASQVLERNSRVKDDLEKISMDEPPPRLFLSTGCALLNLALSDLVNGGWPCGRIVNPIGDSDTGKTVLALAAMAEACMNPAFDGHRLIYIDMEATVTPVMVRQMFGKRLVQRLELMSAGTEECPETIEEVHYLLLELFAAGVPFVAAVDSFDSLPSRQELEETQKTWAEWKKDKGSSGSYQMSKQKYSKKMFRELKGQVAVTDSIIMIVSQTIANIGSMFNPKSVAGGSALEFFSRIRFWLSVGAADKVNNRVIGRNIKCRVSKNHITGKKRDLALWVYDGHGIDDLKTSIDFLTAEGCWPKLGGWIDAQALGVKLQMKELIHYIENNRLEDRVAGVLQETWTKIEEALKLRRTRRYE